MDKLYKTEKSKAMVAIYLAIALILISIFAITFDKFSSDPALPIILILLFLLFGSIWFATFYSIKNGNLLYRSGPFAGKISISTIKEITKNETLWTGFRPALGFKGLIIRYNKWDEIYISPKHKEEFVQKLLEFNKEIVIKNGYKNEK